MEKFKQALNAIWRKTRTELKLKRNKKLLKLFIPKPVYKMIFSVKTVEKRQTVISFTLMHSESCLEFSSMKHHDLYGGVQQHDEARSLWWSSPAWCSTICMVDFSSMKHHDLYCGVQQHDEARSLWWSSAASWCSTISMVEFSSMMQHDLYGGRVWKYRHHIVGRIQSKIRRTIMKPNGFMRAEKHVSKCWD